MSQQSTRNLLFGALALLHLHLARTRAILIFKEFGCQLSMLTPRAVVLSSSHFGTYQNVFQYALSISNGSTDASKSWSTGSTP